MPRGVQMSPGWQERLMERWRQFADAKLGPAITDDMRRYCPVDTGALRDSIEHHMNADALIVKATGGAEGRTYAAWIELGHRVYHPSTGIVGPEVVAPQPFIRPAVYQVRRTL